MLRLGQILYDLQTDANPIGKFQFERGFGNASPGVIWGYFGFSFGIQVFLNSLEKRRVFIEADESYWAKIWSIDNAVSVLET